MTTKTIPTPDEIWGILREVSANQKEFRTNQKEFRTNQKEIQAGQREFRTNQKEIQAGQREFRTNQKEIQAIQRENALQAALQKKETDRRLKELDELFNGQWGKLMEALVKGDLVKLLNSRGIEVTKTAREHECLWNGKEYEYDIIAVNGDEVVVVEVKTTLKMKDLDRFMEKLKMFKKVFREYQDRTVYGAVAYLKANEGTQRNAEKKGMFVIRATGSSASIINAKNFKPKAFV